MISKNSNKLLFKEFMTKDLFMFISELIKIKKKKKKIKF